MIDYLCVWLTSEQQVSLQQMQRESSGSTFHKKNSTYILLSDTCIQVGEAQSFIYKGQKLIETSKLLKC